MESGLQLCYFMGIADNAPSVLEQWISQQQTPEALGFATGYFALVKPMRNSIFVNCRRNFLIQYSLCPLWCTACLVPALLA